MTVSIFGYLYPKPHSAEAADMLDASVEVLASGAGSYAVRQPLMIFAGGLEWFVADLRDAMDGRKESAEYSDGDGQMTLVLRRIGRRGSRQRSWHGLGTVRQSGGAGLQIDEVFSHESVESMLRAAQCASERFPGRYQPFRPSYKRPS